MKLSEILHENLIRIPLNKSDKTEIIHEMIDLLNSAGKIKDREKVLHSVLEREKMMSTGIGNNVAIPHGKSSGVEELVVGLGISSQDINFDSLDGKPVRIIFMLVGPENSSSQHIKMLSRISRLLNQATFRRRMMDAKSALEILQIITEEEKFLDG